MAKASLVTGFFRIPSVARVALLPRRTVVSLSLGSACFFIAFFTIVLPKDSGLAVLLLDYSHYSSFPYPFTIQNLMYIMFFLALGELFLRLHTANRELAFIKEGILPEDDHSVLRVKDLAAIRERITGRFDNENGFLPYLINLSILQFQASKSVDQAVSVLNSTLELMGHRVDLRYMLARYMVWVIPTLGFIGTVVGIAQALNLLDPDNMDLGQVTGNLAVAFNTTIIALILSAILVFLQQAVQKHEELAVNYSGAYCLKNLINRLYVEQAAA
ncbi:MAG: MotA/TolQ/ExbB proton channel family protein [Bdellovibrionales bacterium]|nr:MotA/TolQ/ExbB proton channel family protein [Bdellovibrionales bacterium]